MAVSTPDYPLSWTTPRNVRTFLADMAPKSVGERLARLRNARGLTQEDLAGLLGVRVRTISRWETGESGGLYDNIPALTEALKIAEEDLIGVKQPAKVEPTEMADLRSTIARIETQLTRAEQQRQNVYQRVETMFATIATQLDSLSEALEAIRKQSEPKSEQPPRTKGSRTRGRAA